MTNSREIRVFGLQRSGIHALVNWIIQQSAGPTVFINDIKSLTSNPYVRRDIHLQRINGSAVSVFDIKNELEGNHLPKEYLILGYEDTDLRHVPVGFDELIREAVGPSETVRNVLILRDPYNLFASRLRFFNSANRNPMRTRSDHVAALWKMHAREALRHTLYLGPDTLIVKYNEWFSCSTYRKCVAENLGLLFTDRGIDSVPGVGLPKSEFARFGCGSSFDNQKFHGRAQEMRVLDRWKGVANDPFFSSLFNDSEIIQLSERIFGDIDGTHILHHA